MQSLATKLRSRQYFIAMVYPIPFSKQLPQLLSSVLRLFPASLAYQVRLLLDRVNDIPLQYRQPFGEPSSPEYRQLAGLAEGGLRENLASGSPLGSRLHGATLMEFKRAADLPGMAPTRPQALMADVMIQVC